MIIEHKNLRIFFGDQTSRVSVQDLQAGSISAPVQQLINQEKLHKASGRQVHGDAIIEVIVAGDCWREQEADALQTALFAVGLAVFTADCLPIVLYDSVHHAFSVVHSGWKGALAGIAQKAVQSMQYTYQTQLNQIEIFLGPAARGCCYEIQSDLYDLILKQGATESVAFKDGKIYFDLSLFVVERLVNLGISSANIYTNNNVCTICTQGYCSYRNEKEHAGRQITLAWQKDLR